MRDTKGKFATFVLVMAMVLTAPGILWTQTEEDETSIMQPDATTVRLTARSTAIVGRCSERGSSRRAARSAWRRCTASAQGAGTCSIR